MVEAQSGLSQAKTEVQARARMRRATCRATKLAAQSGREQLRQWQSAAVEAGGCRASLGGEGM